MTSRNEAARDEPEELEKLVEVVMVRVHAFTNRRARDDAKCSLWSSTAEMRINH